MKKLIFITFILFASFVAKSQTGTLKGKVIDFSNKEALPGANVTIHDGHKAIQGTVSDIDGNYMLNVNVSGKYLVKCTYVGYKAWSKDSISVLPGKTTILDIDLSPSEIMIQGVEVSSYRVPLISKDATYSSSVSSRYVNTRYSNTTVNNNSISLVHQVDNKRFNEINASGRLTASELNDFSKWDLWKDIKSNDLKSFQNLWKISPENRYSVQVKDENEKPVINAIVKLRNQNNTILWSTMTDNTGKAELWTNIFGKQSVKNLEIVVTAGDKDYIYQKPELFQKAINELKIPVPCNISDYADIAFIVDATGSMEDEIKFLKSDLIDIVKQTEENIPGLKINLGSVFYRCFGNSYVTKTHQFSYDMTTAIDFIGSQDADEGGNEVVEEALKVAIDSLNWVQDARVRLLFLILDQQPLTTPEIIQKMQYYTKRAAEKGIRIIPVVGSAETKENSSSMEYLLRSMALATNGTYVFLTDHSQIGDAHSKPVTDQYDVELLNTLIKRIIWQFSYAPACDSNVIYDGIADTTTFSNSPIIAHEIIDTSRNIKISKPDVLIQDFTVIPSQDTTVKQSNIDTSNSLTATDTIQPGVGDKIEIKLYPNPTAGLIYVKIDGHLKELYLTDVTGKLLSKFNTVSVSNLEINLKKYTSGIYFLKFNDNGKWFSGKIILLH